MVILFSRATCKYHNLQTIAILYGIRSFVIGFVALHSNISRYQCCHCNIFYSDFVQFGRDETLVFIYKICTLKSQVSLQLCKSTNRFSQTRIFLVLYREAYSTKYLTAFTV